MALRPEAPSSPAPYLTPAPPDAESGGLDRSGALLAARSLSAHLVSTLRARRARAVAPRGPACRRRRMHGGMRLMLRSAQSGTAAGWWSEDESLGLGLLVVERLPLDLLDVGR